MTIRIGTAQPARRLIDFHIKDPAQILAEVECNLDALVALVAEAGTRGCDALALPEDTLGILHWEAGNEDLIDQILPPAVDAMLTRLGQAAAQHDLYLICCNDHIQDGALYNTAFLLGRYLKVNMPYSELGTHTRGTHFPVFETPDLGTVGMLICYDMVFPEAIRCLALNGADIVFAPTLGGAAMGDGDISCAAFRTRAVDNFVYLVVSMRHGGSMIISPKGEIIAEGEGPDDIAIADIDPYSGRDSGNAFD
jgi:predicted amidohydrolase